MEKEEQIRNKLKEIGTAQIKIIIPVVYLERIINWFDFCEVEGFSNEFRSRNFRFLK